jgi:hypothetical protein
MIKFKFNWAAYCPAGAKYTSGGWSPSWVAPAEPPAFKKTQSYAELTAEARRVNRRVTRS